MEKFKCVNYNTTKDWYLKFYKKEDLPKRMHFAKHHRIDEIVIDVEENFVVVGLVCIVIKH